MRTTTPVSAITNQTVAAFASEELASIVPLFLSLFHRYCWQELEVVGSPFRGTRSPCCRPTRAKLWYQPGHVRGGCRGQESARSPRYVAPAQESARSPRSLDEPGYDRIPDLRARCVEDAGGAFLFGLVGSSASNLLRGGLRGGGLAGAARAVSANAPRTAGSLAAYFAVFSASESALSLARRKEDRWNGLAAGAATWAALGARRGAAGAALLGFIWSFEQMDGRILDFLRELDEPTTPRPQRIWPPPAAAPAGAGDFLGILQDPSI
ncbi:hypothetical protein HU200_035030 [Digitaria exilis]|uniref:Mitochondrial import inner membrane translocase subunit TIM22 n=1 Tax=Digitaria exilis TaxID=1010633 RepID=A0A835BJQ2_9POAL|nr:hypothetical protein HU200_035030 [Digitaria exilis]